MIQGLDAQKPVRLSSRTPLGYFLTSCQGQLSTQSLYTLFLSCITIIFYYDSFSTLKHLKIDFLQLIKLVESSELQ